MTKERIELLEEETEDITGGSLHYGWQGNALGGFVDDVTNNVHYVVTSKANYAKVTVYIKSNCSFTDDSEMISYMLQQGWIE